jgi:hypothetical protein
MASRCTSGCKTQNHGSYAECLQSKGVRVAYCNSAGGSDATAQKKWDHELDLYRQVRREGIQPDSTNLPHIREAMALSDAAGAAYGRDFSKADPMEV